VFGTEQKKITFPFLPFMSPNSAKGPTPFTPEINCDQLTTSYVCRFLIVHFG
jgi:hypothetical protein